MSGARRTVGFAQALVLVVSGCTPDGDVRTVFTVRDSAGIVIAENHSGSVPRCALAAEPRVTIGVPDGPEEYQLYRVFGATRLSDGRIALVNQGSQELRYYNPDGTHALSAGREGDGPGEFRRAFYLWALPGDTIWVGDYGPFQFHVFSPTGEWLYTVRPRPEYVDNPGVMAVLADGRSVLGDDGFDLNATGFYPRYQPVIIHARDGSVFDTVGVYPNGLWGRVGDHPNGPFVYPLFESFSQVEARGHTLALGHGARPEFELWDLSEEATLTRLVRWDAGDRVVRATDVATAHEQLQAQYEGLDPALVARLLEPLVSDERPVADEFPAFAGIQIGRDDAIWIREYSRTGNRSDQRWVRFDPEGQIQCSIAIEVSQILEFGSDYVLMLDRDDLDVERVQLFEWSFIAN